MSHLEARIAKLWRASSKIIAELRAEGCHEGADRFAAATHEAVEMMRAADRRHTELETRRAERREGKVIDMLDALKARLSEGQR